MSRKEISSLVPTAKEKFQCQTAATGTSILQLLVVCSFSFEYLPRSENSTFVTTTNEKFQCQSASTGTSILHLGLCVVFPLNWCLEEGFLRLFPRLMRNFNLKLPDLYSAPNVVCSFFFE